MGVIGAESRVLTCFHCGKQSREIPVESTVDDAAREVDWATLDKRTYCPAVACMQAFYQFRKLNGRWVV